MRIVTKYQSPNYDMRESVIDTIVIHYTDMVDDAETLALLCNPKAKVSAHYFINREGIIYQLVDDDKRAWHAGISYWRGKSKLNDNSIGIELANPGHLNGYIDFTKSQMSSLISICQSLIDKHQIKPINIVGHSDIAPDRKKDPGELFDWKLLSDNNIGIYHDIEILSESEILYHDNDYGISDIQKKLSSIGYKIDITDVFDKQTSEVIIAFKRRFIKNKLTNDWDITCQKILDYLYSRYIA
ncbi:N-acetylmuramoyl-L-alanine amidase AmiD precursor [Candidatus Arcanobacter lacustris]|uniref:N-acetylmuramoyl-L-alanine amidase n=1 Tax=Candidatus Arcanibacter lacustris TaxID=1607817 RepID=A0A0F5MQ85_9RICK|nr:N-acetylmuramoyl-L-alanine amidase AmiD precursor [Candidatus Arcanobacter lacustris]